MESVQRKLKAKATAAKYRGLMYDMWEDGSGTKLLGVFLVLPDTTYKKPEIYLLCLCPLEDETNSSGDNQITTIKTHLETIGLEFRDIHFLIADNTSVNPSISRKVMIPLIGCKSHILSLALKKEFLIPFEGLINKVNALCTKLRTCMHRGYLRQANCDLNPFIVNGIRWSSVYTCLKRYVQIRDNVNKQHEDLIDLVLTAREDSEVDGLLTHLEKFESVTKTLQGRTTNLDTANLLFEELLAMYDDLHHLKPEHPIVTYKAFESGMLKILRGSEKDLTVAERAYMERFLITEDNTNTEIADVDAQGSLNFAQAILEREQKRRKLNQGVAKSEYIPLDWIPVTSCEAERLFSLCRKIFTEFRRAMTTKTLEMLIFLKINRELWDMRTVHYSGIRVQDPAEI